MRGRFATLSAQTRQYYVQLACWLQQRWPKQQQPDTSNSIPFIGIAGSQGSGKSTLCDFLQEYLKDEFGLRCVVLSLDDFYLPVTERQHLAESVHPLLATRGVPGTHDLSLLNQVLAKLLEATPESRVHLPVFDKLSDDRLPKSQWKKWSGKPDMILLEGWCVGAQPEPESAMMVPVNSLERNRDRAGNWRRWVNRQLQTDYATLFSRLDVLVFLQTPGMEQVLRWRKEQETEMVQQGGEGMNADQLQHFVMHYERITLAMLQDLPANADVVLPLDQQHNIASFQDNSWPEK